MKNKKDVSKLNSENIENAEKICSSIRQESSEEAKLLLDRAHKEKQRVLSEASKEAERKTQAILQAAEKEMAQMKERVFSTITMEKRKVDLEARSLFMADVIAAVKKDAENFRSNKDYAKFLREAIIEGIKVADDKNPQVFYSHLDEGVIFQFDDMGVKFNKSDFDEIGAIVQSQDNRLLFDNRFSARLKRAYDEIYMKLFKEVF